MYNSQGKKKLIMSCLFVHAGVSDKFSCVTSFSLSVKAMTNYAHDIIHYCVLHAQHKKYNVSSCS